MQQLSGFSRSVGFLGAGNMAGALIRGLVQGGMPSQRICAFDLVAEKLAPLAKLQVQTAPTADDLVRSSEVVIVAVKPGVVDTVLAPHRAAARDKLWISVAAGISTARLEDQLGPCRIIRAMPNTPALVLAGATGLCAGRHAESDDLELARLLFSAVGLTETVAEAQMDALTGLSGSGPAYLMLVIEALADGGVEAGLPRDVALRLAAQTVQGAGRLVLESGLHPAVLKDQVTSPGGTTIAGVAALESAGLRAALMNAVRAATARSRALGAK